MSKLKKTLIISVISLVILMFLGGFSLFINTPLKSRITVEAGDNELKQTDFYKNPQIYEALLNYHIPLINCKMVTSLSDIPFDKPGEYSVQFLVNGKINTTLLTVEDTESPVILTKEVVIATGEKCKKEDFVDRIEDATNTKLKAEGLSEYKGKSGVYKIKLIATDLGGNKSEETTLLYVLDVKRKLKIELGTKDLSASKFLTTEQTGLKLEYREKFNIKKALKKTGKYKVPLVAVVKKNKKNIDLKLEVEDTKPPIIKGVRNLTMYIGSPFSYREGVSVTDNQPGGTALMVDASGVNPKKEGIYKVFYRSEDKAGNKAEKGAEVIVRKSDKSHVAEVAKYVKDTLEEITKKDMTELEKLDKIFEFCHTKINYTGYSDKSNSIEAAYNGFRTRTGDCFTYYAVSEALISGAGFENIMVTRDGGSSDHFWNLIKYKDKWYHFDTCPLAGAGSFRAFMIGDLELAEFSKDYGKANPMHKDYYNFEKNAYPDRAMHKAKED
ncbi:MAG: transglutaminase domain-containing protein [Catonella sp.]|uniref:transglutaminase domain-containing protein n=1 Tax=Catonella sp. TaxID=2382125 RepID=UPI003FA11A49